MIDEQGTARPASDVICTVLENGEAVLLHLGSKACFTLNETGVVIWRLLEEGLSLASIAERLEAEYDVTRDEAAHGVVELVGELAACGLVSPGRGEPPPGD